MVCPTGPSIFLKRTNLMYTQNFTPNLTTIHPVRQKRGAKANIGHVLFLEARTARCSENAGHWEKGCVSDSLNRFNHMSSKANFDFDSKLSRLELRSQRSIAISCVFDEASPRIIRITMYLFEYLHRTRIGHMFHHFYPLCLMKQVSCLMARWQATSNHSTSYSALSSGGKFKPLF